MLHFLHTVPSAPPVNTSGDPLSSTSITLSWSPPPLEHQNGIIRSYFINSTEIETNATYSYTLFATGPTLSMTINSLHPYYTYQLTITAVTIGPGPPTNAFTVVTPPDGMLINMFTNTVTQMMSCVLFQSSKPILIIHHYTSITVPHNTSSRLQC